MQSTDLKVSQQPRHTLPHMIAFDERSSLNDDLESYGDIEDREEDADADFNQPRAQTSQHSMENNHNFTTEPRHQRIMSLSHTSNTTS